MNIEVKGTLLILKQGDITCEKVDAVVNAANSMLAGGGGVDDAIHQAAGETMEEECRKVREMQGGCPTGEAVITTAGNLPCKYVIHTVGPVWKDGCSGEEELLRNCYWNSLKLAMRTDLKTIAFPAVSTGAYGYPVSDAALISLDEVIFFLKKNHPHCFREIRFVLFTQETMDCFVSNLKFLQKKHRLN